jgi:putative DNA methylase
MTSALPKRLIEVDLPIKRISAHARREKSIRHGHISTLHIWWARRPLAACRAVVCASLWPDPADPNCPKSFREAAREQMQSWTKSNLRLLSAESLERFVKFQQNPSNLQDNEQLRLALLDFIADFSNWDNSVKEEYLRTSRALTHSAHEALGGSHGSRPLVVDPFAGGGAIPFEVLRIGGDAFASDVNPVAVYLNKVVLEYLPRYGKRLADELRKWGGWVQLEAAAKLEATYPQDSDGAKPIAYLWARTIRCEGPACGAEVPLMGRSVIGSRNGNPIALRLKGDQKTKHISIEIVEGEDARKSTGSSKGFVVACPRPKCGFSTPKKSVQRQLTEQRGGADSSRLLAVLTEGPQGRCYRLANNSDEEAFQTARRKLQLKLAEHSSDQISLIPDEPIPPKTAHRAVGSQLPLYGFQTWGDLFNSRQKLAILTLQELTRKVYELVAREGDEQFAHALFLLLAFSVNKQADYLSSLCRWVSKGEFIAGTLAGEKKLPMMADYAEANPVGSASGSWDNHIDWIARFIEREAQAVSNTGVISQSSAEQPLLPWDSAAAMITDPPYYDSVPYSDLSDFFYVWLRRTLMGIEQVPADTLTPKTTEMTVNHPDDEKERIRYEKLLTSAFENGRNITSPEGIGVIVFAHKSTSGWETLLEAIIRSGWIVTASWPIDTERSARLNALRTASLASSVHIVCRPRKGITGEERNAAVGDWRDVLQQLPSRIHEWMPRLEQEGVVGADAIFACIGPALEIFSRYASVEKASGQTVTLREYLEHVWAAVAKEALTILFRGADTSGFEEDARLTAMWLWTLVAGSDTADSPPDGKTEEPEPNTGIDVPKGYVIEYDAARKIAQGLGAHLEGLSSLVEIDGDMARLLTVAERTRKLFGKDEDEAPVARKKKTVQLQLSFAEELEQVEETGAWGKKGIPTVGETVLDRIHQCMILFAAGRGEALRRFLIDEGVGSDERFWRLAQVLSYLYPKSSDEKRWIDGVLARKKGLGF